MKITVRSRRPSICAVIAARNELPYLRVLLPILAEQQIDVVVLDNESADGSVEFCKQLGRSSNVSVETIPYNGFFSLTDQLLAKKRQYERLQCDWIIHQDADEILEHTEPGRNLRDAIEEADASGYNVVNFEEFVFLPDPGDDYARTNYYLYSLRHYFFAPETNRLNRAWKSNAHGDNLDAGGHRFHGTNLSVFPQNHVLRHYIVLSQQHAFAKYLNRSFDPADLNRGWHGNRRGFSADNLRLPEDSRFISKLPSHNSKAFRRDMPTTKHFWEW